MEGAGIKVEKKNALTVLALFGIILIILGAVDTFIVSFYIGFFNISPEVALINSTKIVIGVNELIFALVTILAAFKLFKWSWNDLGFTSKRILFNVLLGLIVGVVGYFVAMVFVYIITLFVPVEIPAWFVQMLTPKDTLDLTEWLVLTWVLVGSCEELFFRALIQGSVSRWLGSKAGVVVGAIVFGLAHFNPALWIRSLATFLLGAIYGIVYDKRRSLPVVAVAHSINDSIAFILSSLL